MMHRHVTDTGQEQFQLGGSGLPLQLPQRVQVTQRITRGENMIDKRKTHENQWIQLSILVFTCKGGCQNCTYTRVETGCLLPCYCKCLKSPNYNF